MQQRSRALCSIIGAGHSGSTLLGMILGAHPEAFYAGEAAKARYLGDANKPLRKRACKLCGLVCPVWSTFRISERTDIYDQLTARTGKPIIVDSTKGIAWLQERRRELQGKACQQYVVFLKRDGRAVINSRIRKYPNRSVEGISRQWLTQIADAKQFYDSHRGPRMSLHYEDFAECPEGFARELCALLEIEYRPSMLSYWNTDQHPLGGNNGTQYLAARARCTTEDRRVPCSDLNPANRQHYGSHAYEITIDDRWKSELSDESRDVFYRLTGDANSEFARD